MTREELIAAAFAELTAQGHLPAHLIDRLAVAAVVVDAVEPLIRKAAEEHVTFLWGGRGWVEHRDCGVRLAELRAQVEALRDKWQKSIERDPLGHLSTYDRAHVGALNDVLGLIDRATS